MNLILFTREEIARPQLAPGDARARHVREVLKRAVGETFDLGVIDGPRGKGRVVALAEDGAVTFVVELGMEPPRLAPVHLIVGLPRPQTAKKILNELTTLGVSGIDFVVTERTDPSYAQSSLWRGDEWREHVLEGAQQAFCTRLPRVTAGTTLVERLSASAPAGEVRLALDNYEASVALGSVSLSGSGTTMPASSPTPVETSCVVLAVGPERGWGPKDRAGLRAAGFTLVHLGERVLRVETACVAAVAVMKSRLGWS